MQDGEDVNQPDEREERRKRLLGRAMLIGLALLLLAYILATFVR